MQVILISKRFARAKSVLVTPRQVVAGVLGVSAIPFALACLTVVLVLHEAANTAPGPLQRWLLSVYSAQALTRERDASLTLNRIATRIGEVQARVTQLGLQDAYVADQVGLKIARHGVISGAGHGQSGVAGDQEPVMPTGSAATAPSVDELVVSLNQLSRQVEARTDFLDFFKSRLLNREVNQRFMPTSMPVKGAVIGSGFGTRIDPFNGKPAMHEGLDFVAAIGTPVYAAAGGMVTYAERNPDYGNLIEIDHGNGFTTRYAHCSQLLVREGDIVLPGEHIASVGDTGRATGPHLHFEVRYLGAARDPTKYLMADSPDFPRISLAHRHNPD